MNGWKPLPNGVMQPIEMYGPANIHEWQASWNVFQNAMVMLDIVDLGTLTQYSKLINELSLQLGPNAWPLLYQADNRARNELLTHIQINVWQEIMIERRKNPPGSVAGYEEDRPWNLTFARMVDDDKFWQREVRMPGLQVAVRVATLSDVVQGDAPVARAANSLFTATGVVANPQPPQLAAFPAPSGVPRTGKHRTNRAGSTLCEAFNHGNCQHTAPNNTCPVDPTKRHQCSNCLQIGHGAHECNARAAVMRPMPTGGGRDKGKGKGKGRGRGINGRKTKGKYCWAIGNYALSFSFANETN